MIHVETCSLVLARNSCLFLPQIGMDSSARSKTKFTPPLVVPRELLSPGAMVRGSDGLDLLGISLVWLGSVRSYLGITG